MTMANRIIAIHQPNFMPWLGYFQKMSMADAFIFLDDVQFTKGSYINRTQINTPQGAKWLTIPVKYSFSKGENIAEVRIDNSQPWLQSHLDQIKTSYYHSPFFKEAWEIIRPLYEKNPSLIEFNIRALTTLKKILSLDCEIFLSSNLAVQEKGSKRLAVLVKKIHGDVYLSGDGSESYLQKKDFSKRSIDIKYVKYDHPVYPQCDNHGFRLGLSVIDAIFNCGIDNIPLSSTELDVYSEKY